MNLDELDRILADDSIEPGSGFVDAVMRAAARSAAEPRPLPFPWGPFAVGVAACAAMAAAGASVVPGLVGPLAPLASSLAPLAPLASDLGPALAAVALGYAVSRLPRALAQL